MRKCVAVGLLVALGGLWGAGPARAAIGDNSVGMNVHDGRGAFIDAAVDLGVGWVRMDANWWVLETSQGSYNWTSLDSAVNDAVAQGLEVYLTLAYTPSWLARHGDSDGWHGNDVPDNAQDWYDFVFDAVTHYHALGVTHFGIWNEPNLTGFFEGTVNEYVNVILVPGANAVRAACSTCFVLGPDLAHVGAVDEYLEDVMQLAPAGTFDIIAHHIYQGFEETGVQVWDGDRFFNALDQQRFTFTRRSIRQILDAAGWAGEVWITETGYRADPPGDVAEEDLQAIYVTRVLEEQLSRAWYTNTFFYEILDCKPDQPDCTIDGFGLMRAVSGSPGSRVFPTDFRLKPAYDALKQFIADHPEITGAEPPPACGDGVDNDGDGALDLADRGCEDAFDDDESDDPPRERLESVPAQGLTLDGSLSDWGLQGWVTVPSSRWQGTEALGAGDLSVRVASRWEAGALWLAVEVTDDVQDNGHQDSELWMGDSLQIAFDVGKSLGFAYDDLDDHELNLALVGGQTRTYRFHGPTGASDAVEAVIQRAGSITSYEIRLPSAVVPGVTYSSGATVGFSFLVNDADGGDRVGWLEWTPGIGMQKAPYYYGEIALVEEVTPPADGGVPWPDAGLDGGPDGGPGADGTPGVDGGGEPGDKEPGCGCQGGAPAGVPQVWFGLVLLWLGYRRRRAPAPPVRER
ncbi:MAG: sugar-binding protein [Polyangia bacterium]|jgi:uncharacterized protein (TIGR03382 family)|nr:sugar-binding protein [Polyangia bacterium]